MSVASQGHGRFVEWLTDRHRARQNLSAMAHCTQEVLRDVDSQHSD